MRRILVVDDSLHGPWAMRAWLQRCGSVIDECLAEPHRRYAATLIIASGAGMTRVLVVDDDPMVCMAIEIYLERHGFEVTIADGGEVGLRALEEVSFDLMIVDIFMPHMRGFEFDQDIPRASADGSTHCNVRICFCEPGLARAGLPANGSRARRGALFAQAVHADGVADDHQRMSCRTPIPLHGRRAVEIAVDTTPVDAPCRGVTYHDGRRSRGGKLRLTPSISAILCSSQTTLPGPISRPRTCTERHVNERVALRDQSCRGRQK